jgi:hypothetical protein
MSLWQKIFLSSSVKKGEELSPQEKGAATSKRSEPSLDNNEVKNCSVSHLNIKDMFPEEVAVLHVQMDGKDMFRLVGANRFLPLDVRQQDKPPRSLGESIRKEIPASEIRRAFIDYSVSKVELRRWLIRLLEKYRNELKLIIIDHTHFEVPWELIDLHERHYVGSMIPTTRWLDVFTPTAEPYSLTVAHDECAGRTLSCYLYQEVDHRDIEAEALSKLDYNRTGDLLYFFEMLCQLDSSVGMVIVSSHAFFEVGKSREISVGSKVDSQNRLPLSTFRETQLGVIKASRPIVFLNGCDSARVTSEEERFVSSYRLGFPEVFLAKGARGFIGTLAAVVDLHAAEYARDFIDKALKNPDMPVAAILKELRAEAVAALPINPVPDDSQSRKFLNTFMYVYYGNPLTNLKLKEA